MSEYSVITESLVDVIISSNITSFNSQKKFDKSLTIADLKMKLEMITGGTAANMKISLFDKDDKAVCEFDNNEALLGSYPVESGHRLHVIDDSKITGEFENTAAVEKFELSKEEYNKKQDTVAAYLKRNKLGKYNEEEMANMAKEKENQELEEEKRIESGGLVVDARCEVRVPGQLPKRGAIRFVGKVHFQPGWWVGVQYDEPTGKNDGSVGGKRYFTCTAKYGGFVKPNTVEVGDFPEEELDLSEGEM
ncbi:tubulin-folding cofactor B [Eurytemora carolleeae]|uniref:tubulin-folding cofactor B n=1 Tax=Eurytemora carolleeae TaxID=1294199 RepID=UPI000C777A04|nr:tubulin-folding cofactor B [Eurytemora carolleeae]|eukprot:XP_023325807.1 tubulin-folding cofactor B-like [Eurytemora affinis]